MIVTLWLRGPAQLLIPPATLARFARLTARWRRSRLLLDLTRPSRLSVTVIEGDTHAG